MALISATQSKAVCSAFCNVTLGLAIHAMFNVAHGTLSAQHNAFDNVMFPRESDIPFYFLMDSVEMEIADVIRRDANVSAAYPASHPSIVSLISLLGDASKF